MIRASVFSVSAVLFNVFIAAGAEPAKEKDDSVKLTADNNAFAFDLYTKIREEKGNLFFSPASISSALAMTYVGAREKTAEEMAKVLHFTLGQEKLHPAFASLLVDWNGQGVDASKRGYQLSVANALWGQARFPWKKELLETTRTNYKGGLREVNFETAHEEARGIINSWVEQETREKIKELITKDLLTPDTRLVLTNAIYFKGDWAAQFDKRLTKEDKFFISTDKTVNVPLMHRKGNCRYAADKEVQLLELPYKGNDLSMLFLLPRKKNGLADVEKDLSAEKHAVLHKGLHKGDQIDVYLPKFKIEQKMLLTKILQEMGMKDAFDPMKANFSGMTTAAALSISFVVHKAFVEVNEEGTEAAAATGVGLTLTSASPGFRADHPFLFLIRDNRNGSILFMGRVSDPSGK